MREKDLCYALANSRQLKGYKANDRIAILFLISERNWDPGLFQSVIAWFIQDFCIGQLPAHSPQFFFFFGVEYEEEDSEVADEVKGVLESQEAMINPLAELDMVTKKDVQQWFDNYRTYWRKTSDRKRTFRKYFKTPFDESGALYMEDVQDFLQQIINEINESVKDANRS